MSPLPSINSSDLLSERRSSTPPLSSEQKTPLEETVSSFAETSWSLSSLIPWGGGSNLSGRVSPTRLSSSEEETPSLRESTQSDRATSSEESSTPGFFGRDWSLSFFSLTAALGNLMPVSSGDVSRAPTPPLSEDQFNSNLELLSSLSFAYEQNPATSIKSLFGTLVKGHGIVWALRYAQTEMGIATQLDGTVRTLDRTMQKLFTKVRDKEKEITTFMDDKGLDLSQPEKEALLRIAFDLTKDIVQVLQVSEGLVLMLESYEERYKEEPKHAGLQEFRMLNKLIDNDVECLLAEYKQVEKGVMSVLGMESSLLTRSLVPGNPSSDLEAYCNRYCVDVSTTIAEEKIAKGKLLIQRILTSDEPISPSENPLESQEELAFLTWFLMSCAMRKEQAYDEGAFAIEDQNERLYQFLLSSPGHAAGERASSHYVGRCEPYVSVTASLFKASKQYGVDVLEANMPAGKRTILFGMVDNFPMLEGIPKKVLFFKPENFSPFLTTGMGYDALMHGYEFTMAQYTKQFDPKGDDLPEYRKERVPSELLERFNKILVFLGKCIEDREGDWALLQTIDSESNGKSIKDFQKQAKLWGIQYMYSFISKVSKLDWLTINEKLAFHAVATPCMETMEIYDHPERRTGREVYLKEEDLLGE
ncbi:MAG: hypothetical protein WCG42_03330 [Parachlamydiaceae bacterium]